ncbi:MAG: GNAT family N-acetyltransferase [Gemmatimonadetes bacterium]|nr:GNAT family N-acetyltransferase [Gemmatimonadota bacterium]
MMIPSSPRHVRLSDRTIVEALRSLPPSHGVEDLLFLDAQTLGAPVAARTALVYDPAPLLLEQMQAELSAAEWAQHVPAEASHRVGALAGGALVALASVGAPHERLAQIHLVVAPPSRRRGLGHLVLDTIVRRIVAQGLIPFVNVGADLRARRLALRVGFVGLDLKIVA